VIAVAWWPVAGLVTLGTVLGGDESFEVGHGRGGQPLHLHQARAATFRPAAATALELCDRAFGSAVAARTDESGAWTASLDTVRENLGDWTVSAAFVEHSDDAGSAAGSCAI
jgi:hypothetical protein